MMISVGVQKLLIVSCLLLGVLSSTRHEYAQGHIRDRDNLESAATIPNETSLTPEFFPSEGSKRTKISYGPFEVPNMNINNGMISHFTLNIDIGCKDCIVTWMQAGLEYPDGSYANANTSLWLHHTVLYNMNNLDTVCGANVQGERFFASGNERMEVDLSNSGTNTAGYFVGANDTIGFLVELMNQAMENQTAVVTITYEYIPGHPTTFNEITPVWLDIGGCSTSEMPAKNETTFQYTSPVWSANVTGRITFEVGHIHDGGTYVQIAENNSTICDSQASYGQTPGYVDPSGSMSMGAGMVSPMSNMGKHISSMSKCTNGQLNLGDELSITAYYNTSEYEAMTNTDGSLSSIMGIALLYLAANETAASTTGATPTTSRAVSSSSTGAAAIVTTGPALVVGVLSGMLALGFA
ncbi:hypothetical protein LSUB1_G003915 [Lachnellula subtilissima]|uniref:Uncharacterized protein n=1 Tax=Lachnellula subtilissima TaxID=602034 RepID=A0A8H8UFS8_9HELO|nr:hypothetical protein LSUB1_G003915 [Lachnellula subtilissima]